MLIQNNESGNTIRIRFTRDSVSMGDDCGHGDRHSDIRTSRHLLWMMKKENFSTLFQNPPRD